MTAVNTRRRTMPDERDNMGEISRLKHHSGEVYQLIASLKASRDLRWKDQNFGSGAANDVASCLSRTQIATIISNYRSLDKTKIQLTKSRSDEWLNIQL